jgi:glycosyltransferase involved in cell wall biosynthesis
MKGVPMLLEALKALSSSTPCGLTIIGDGSERALLEKQTEELGLRANVRFLGARPLSEVPAAMRDAHVFCLPSVRESGGAVLLEAMAAARPVVAIKYGGPAEVVTDEVGRAIEPVGREYVVKELLTTFQEIVKHPDSWRLKGVAGRRRAESEFGWEAKVNRTMELYARLVNREQSANATRTPPGTSSAADENEQPVHSYHEVK